jgi:ribose-phosphate pyrophosphokinase
MPYSRMDRRMGTDVFTLKYACDFINSLGFTQIYVHESHSDVAVALLNNYIAFEDGVHLFELVSKEIEFDKEKDYVFFPDAGAQKRYSKLDVPNQLVGFKKRNVETGKIDSLQVVGEIEPGSYTSQCLKSLYDRRMFTFYCFFVNLCFNTLHSFFNFINTM